MPGVERLQHKIAQFAGGTDEATYISAELAQLLEQSKSMSEGEAAANVSPAGPWPLLQWPAAATHCTPPLQ